MHDLGVLAFCGSAILVIWTFGLREKFSGEETASAYSVFNENGKAIVGGFTAAQFDSQMRGGGIGTENKASSSQNNPVKGSVAMAAKTASTKNTQRQSDGEKLRRRKAAAAAAEKRLRQKTVED